MIKPTIGRTVLYRPVPSESSDMMYRDQALAAMITYVWNDRLVNVAVFDANGRLHGRTSVPLYQDGDRVPTGSYCEWMPYQIQLEAEK